MKCETQTKIRTLSDLENWEAQKLPELNAKLQRGMESLAEGRRNKPILNELLHSRAIARFRSKYQESDGCWLWDGSKFKNGYGKFRMAHKSFIASRIAYRLATGIDPLENDVCHSCDNPACVNPAHLLLGDHESNMRDMYSKGRRIAAKGEKHGMAKLNEDKVLIIRSIKAPCNYRRIAKDFGIDPSTVSDIRRRKIWKHI